MQALSDVKNGSRVKIVEIAPSARFKDIDAQVTQRLKELGFLPGAELSVIGFGFWGADPLAVKLGSTKFALRRHEAEKVRVQAI